MRAQKYRRKVQISKGPWFVTILKKVGVTDRKTADIIVIFLVVVMFIITIFSFMSESGATDNPTIEFPPEEINET